MVEEVRTLKDIQDFIIFLGGLKDTTSVRTNLTKQINNKEMTLAAKKFYSWSGKTEPLKFRARYSTGTVSITNGSDLVTGTSTSWGNVFDITGSKFLIPGTNRPYRILRYDSASEVITLDTPFVGTTNATAGYYIFKDEYGMFPDFQDLRYVMIPDRRSPLEREGINFVDSKRTRTAERGGNPIYCTIHGYNYYCNKTWATFNIGQDFWEDDKTAKRPRNKNLIFWPALFDTDINALIRYTIIPPPMVADSDEPTLYLEWRSALAYGTLLEHYLKDKNITIKREWQGEYNKIMKLMDGDIEQTDDDLTLRVRSSNFIPKRRYKYRNTLADFDD